MIYRLYGTSYQSVDLNFDAHALNEVGFRRNRKNEFPAEDLAVRYRAVAEHDLTTEASGAVQGETEQLLLDRLRDKVEALVGGLPEGGILVIPAEPGHDYPKTRQVIKNVIEEGENRHHFEYTLAPPLRVEVYAPAE